MQLHTYQKGRSLLVPIYWSSQKTRLWMKLTMQNIPMQSIFLACTFGANHNAVGHHEKSKDIWLPPGEWANWQNSSEVYQGPKKLYCDNLGLEDTPVFVNTSGIMPTPAISSTMKQRKRSGTFSTSDPIIWVVLAHGSTTTAHSELFEDDGISMD